MLYLKDDVDLEYCKFCGDARYKLTRELDPRRKKSLYAVLRYLPLTPYLQRLYASRAAKHMTCHATHQMEEGSLCHPSDVEAWKHSDQTYPDFAEDSHNVRLGLYTDSFAPHGKYSCTYSCWTLPGRGRGQGRGPPNPPAVGTDATPAPPPLEPTFHAAVDSYRFCHSGVTYGSTTRVPCQTDRGVREVLQKKGRRPLEWPEGSGDRRVVPKDDGGKPKPAKHKSRPFIVLLRLDGPEHGAEGDADLD
ncbi:UNVERIFIED_CONTAM: hypothetical protein Sradi_3635900 [Sesamum radiatum]|uniref:Uncharacterized protein n=1 Tax=Sesamum radiatum TaxID=300843 RepID=A0AAW2QHV7_SESRA